MKRDGGASLLEFVIVLTLLALLASAVVALHGGSEAQRAATALQAFTLAARIEAVRRNVPVAVAYDPSHRRFEQRIGDSETSFGDPCASAPLRTLSLSRYRRVTVFRRLRDDLVWLPTGIGRTCSGGGVSNGTIELGDRRPRQRLVVSSAGRVRTEAVR